MKKVLIVEDDPFWTAIISRYVDGLAEVKTAISGGQAMELIDNWRPDCLILDMLLTGETGVALLNELRSHSDLIDMPVIICSSVELEKSDVEPFGVRAILQKATMTPDEARMVICEVLA